MDYFVNRQGSFFCEDISFTELAEIHGTPLYVYSGSTVDKHCKALKEALSKNPALLCFAVKANSNLSLLKRIFSNGFGADVVSVGELERALIAGANPKEIVFSGVGKKDDEIARGLKAGILSFNVESVGELKRIAALSTKLGVKAPVSLRLNPNIDAKTHPHIATGLYSTKFGIAETELSDALSVVRSEKNLELVGLACHIGSQILQSEPFQQAARRMAALAKSLISEQFQLKILNLGGGVGIRYSDEKPVPLSEYASLISQEVKSTGLKLVIEPGRVIVGNAGVLLTRVIVVKKTPRKMFVVVDAGMNDLIRPSLYEAFHEIVPVVEKESLMETVDVVGPICETGDFLGLNRAMRVPDPGDLLFVRTAGAYGMSMASHYNSRPLAAEVLVDQDHMQVIRAREPLSSQWELELAFLDKK